VDYDLLGNITKKTDVSANTWTYHATKKHAVTATGGGPTYSYDANGNVSAKSGATISWYSFNLPNVINGSGVSSQFWYGPSRERIKHVANFTASSETTHYIGGLMEKVVSATNTHYRHYIAAPTGLVATYTRRVSAPLEDTFYFTHDHLGSIDSVTNQSAAMQVRLSFDVLGKRRNEAGWSGAVPSADWTAIASTSRRGYTEHEVMDNLTLTHMNGRVYDQTIGRFVSGDPFVQAPYYSQSLNRYAYVWNNPLTLIDPSGFAGGHPDPDCPRCSPPRNPDYWITNIMVLFPRPHHPDLHRNDVQTDGKLSTSTVVDTACISAGTPGINPGAEGGPCAITAGVGLLRLDLAFDAVAMLAIGTAVILMQHYFERPDLMGEKPVLIPPLDILSGQSPNPCPDPPDCSGRPEGTAATGTSIGTKIEGQLATRGWSRSSIDDAIANPTRTVATRDTRHLPGGARMNDSATAYYSREGGYVVRNDRTGDIVQISDRTNPNWRAPWD
jgi:RHS repeat-associated protein